MVSRGIGVITSIFSHIKSAMNWSVQFLLDHENATVVAMVFFSFLARTTISNLIGYLTQAVCFLGDAGAELFGAAWAGIKRLGEGVSEWMSPSTTIDKGEATQESVDSEGGVSALFALVFMAVLPAKLVGGRTFSAALKFVPMLDKVIGIALDGVDKLLTMMPQCVMDFCVSIGYIQPFGAYPNRVRAVVDNLAEMNQRLSADSTLLNDRAFLASYARAYSECEIVFFSEFRASRAKHTLIESKCSELIRRSKPTYDLALKRLRAGKVPVPVGAVFLWCAWDW
jgi:hypothetical protein